MTRTLWTVAVMIFAAAPALAVKTQHFTHTSADDFKKGSAKNVVVTSAGQLRLSRHVEPLLPDDRHFDAIQALAEAPNGAVVFSAFPDGEVLSLTKGTLTSLATFKDQTVTSLAYDAKGRLLIGVGGEKARLMRIDTPGEAPRTVCELADAKYVWAVLPYGDITFLATGPGGAVFKVDDSGTPERFASLAGDNVMCLTADRSSLYAGTDRDALLYKINLATAKPYVLYDAAESEISSLVWDGHGNLLAATSDAREDPTDKPNATPQDTPPHPASKNDLPATPPATPRPPEEKPGDALPRQAPATPASVQTTPASAPSKTMERPPEDDGPAAGPFAGPVSNAVYRIDPQGLVTEVLRKPVIIYGMAAHGDAIVLATGEDGEVYECRPSTGEEGVLLRTDAVDATGLLTARDGTLYVATSNAGQIFKLSAGNAKQGTYDSEVLDATLPSRFGQLHLQGTTPAGTTMSVQTRAGNVADADSGEWGDWSAPVPATEFLPVTSGPARYLQYRLTFETTDPGQSPSVDQVDAAYQKPNLPPKIASVSVLPGEGGQMTLSWDASDANDDPLRYAVFVQIAGRGAWMKIVDDLSEATYPWSAKNVPDGTYEVKVVASDAASNVPGGGGEVSRTGDGVLIDNTPPVIGDVTTTADDGKVVVRFRVIDRAGTVAAADTTLDQVAHWQKQLPDDNMADSPEERYAVPLSGLASGSHSLMIRATDARGNAAYETVAVTVP